MACHCGSSMGRCCLSSNARGQPCLLPGQRQRPGAGHLRGTGGKRPCPLTWSGPARSCSGVSQGTKKTSPRLICGADSACGSWAMVAALAAPLPWLTSSIVGPCAAAGVEPVLTTPGVKAPSKASSLNRQSSACPHDAHAHSRQQSQAAACSASRDACRDRAIQALLQTCMRTHVRGWDDLAASGRDLHARDLELIKGRPVDARAGAWRLALQHVRRALAVGQAAAQHLRVPAQAVRVCQPPAHRCPVVCARLCTGCASAGADRPGMSGRMASSDMQRLHSLVLQAARAPADLSLGTAR